MICSEKWISSRTARLITAAVLLIVTADLVYAQDAEDAFEPLATATAPYALFNYSSLTGSGNTVTASWVPVVLSDGSVSYKNLTLLFNVDSSGNLTIAPGYPKIMKAPVILVSTFKAGSYVGPSTILGGNALVNVSGPGATLNGATEWSLATVKNANGCTYPATATWYVGPLTSNPLYPRIKAAGITSTAWSYGVAEGFCYAAWNDNPLIGVSQIGSTITFVSFTTGNVDHNEPQDTITYTMKQQ